MCLFSAPDWKTVADLHNNSWGNPVRNPESCRKKFGRDREAKPPTGDPNCPPHIVLAKRAFCDITTKCQVEDGDDSESGSDASEEEDDGDNVEDDDIAKLDDTLDDSSYEDESADVLHQSPKDIADTAMMDVFSPATEVVNNTLQDIPNSLTPTLTPGPGDESVNNEVDLVEDTRRSLAGDINDSAASEPLPQAKKRPSRKKRGTLGPGVTKLLQITRKRHKITNEEEKEVKGTDSILEIMKLNMISKMAAESNQEARRVEERQKDEIKLQRQKEKDDAKEERLMRAEQNRHEQLVMQGQQFQMMMMMMMRGKSPESENPLPVMQTLMPSNNAMSSVTESPRSIPKDPDVIIQLDNLK